MSIYMAKLCLKPIFSLGNNTNRGRVVAQKLWRELELKLDALESALLPLQLGSYNRESPQLCFCS
jgi:hypothetical protein